MLDMACAFAAVNAFAAVKLLMSMSSSLEKSGSSIEKSPTKGLSSKEGVMTEVEVRLGKRGISKSNSSLSVDMALVAVKDSCPVVLL